MSFKTQMPPSTGSCSDSVDRLRAALDRADAVVVGAGAGLSASAGFDYGGARFRAHFADFEARYGFHDMYTGGFYPYPTPEEQWAFWSRGILLNRYGDPPGPVDEALRRENMQATLILQVHDELLIECPPEEAERAAALLRECMEQVMTLSVPLAAEVHQGANWYETK